MTMKLSHAKFLELWNEYRSITKISMITGLDCKGLHKRRRRIEEKTGKRLRAQGKCAVHIPNNKARLGVNLPDGIILVGSDCHYLPDQKTTAHRAFVEFVRQLKPDVVVMNGDILDASTVSMFPSIGWETKPTLKEEISACRDRLDEIYKAYKPAQHIWTLGNHDMRFETRIANVAPEYRGIIGIHLKDHFPEWEPCWSVNVNNMVCMIKHRWHNGIHSTYNNTLKSGTSIVTGHLHSLQIRPYTDYNGTRYGVDTGTLAVPYDDQFVNYTEDNPVNWRSGFVLLTFHKGHLLPPEIIQVWDEDGGVVWFRGGLINV